MKLIAPDYYPDFACIADQCRHSCCKGWEIDIDEDTLQMYRQLPGEMGERLRRNITEEDGVAFFRLREDESCPFLNEQGLCDLILHGGEEMLCQICSDHPRFRYDYSDRTEIGLGLCCEEAARLILTRREPVRLLEMEYDGIDTEMDDEERAFFAWREQVFSLVQNRAYPLRDRLNRLCALQGLPAFDDISTFAYKPFLMQLERMDEAWTKCLEKLDEDHLLPGTWDVPLEQLLMVLLYRHLPASLEDENRKGRLLFALFGCKLVASLLAPRPETEHLIEIARLFSSEIEYSDENTVRLFERLTEDCRL